MVTPEQIKQLIESGLAGAEARVAGDDGTHFEAIVISPAFAGQSMIAQHRMVYGALGARMGTEIHALSLRTLTPEQASAAGFRPE